MKVILTCAAVVTASAAGTPPAAQARLGLHHGLSGSLGK
jgi:hypothetical protein